MDLDLKGKCAVVAGSAQGIGRAIARAFAAEGAQLALIDRDPRVGETARQLAEEYHVRTLPLTADGLPGTLAANATARGRPTRPNPPTTTTSKRRVELSSIPVVSAANSAPYSKRARDPTVVLCSASLLGLFLHRPAGEQLPRGNPVPASRADDSARLLDEHAHTRHSPPQAAVRIARD